MQRKEDWTNPFCEFNQTIEGTGVAASASVRIRVAGILVRRGEVLLVRHQKDAESYWLLPGGGVEVGETLKQALEREWLEEVGLSIQAGRLVLVHDSIPSDHHRHIVNLCFLVEARGAGAPRVSADERLKEARFFELPELRRLRLLPGISDDLARGIASGWSEPCLYLGNNWSVG